MNPQRKTARRAASGFTLLELLIVIGIIGLLAAIGIPALKGFGATNAVQAGTRQLLDDINMARQHAMNQRTTVYMVFVPEIPTYWTNGVPGGLMPQMLNLVSGQYTAYNFLTLRTVGDQPGQGRARYLSEWKRLPEGVFIPSNKLMPDMGTNVVLWASADKTNRSLPFGLLPFPSGRSPTRFVLPYIAFNHRGELLGPDRDLPRGSDEFLQLTRGTIIFPKSAEGKVTFGTPEVIEQPRDNARNNPIIQIDWVTGRARVKQPEGA